MNRGKLTKCLPVYLSFNYNIFGNIARRLSNYAWSSLFYMICDGYSCHMHATTYTRINAQQEKKTHWEDEIEGKKIIDMIAFSVRFFLCLLFAGMKYRRRKKSTPAAATTILKTDKRQTYAYEECVYVHIEENCRGKLISFIRTEKVFEYVFFFFLPKWFTHRFERERKSDI